MRKFSISILILSGVVLLGVGCRKNAVDKTAFKLAINNYYSGRQECLWTVPVKFPVQADASNDEQTKGFDALTDAGMLTRKAEEKKRFLIGSKQVTDYDISEQGRTVWTPDQTQPGYGNFCIGHFAVTTIDDYTPADDPNATQYTVNYHYSITGVPTWANTTEIKTAFPRIAADTSAQSTAIASLAKSNDGWQVVNVHPATPGS
jgi:hypothetical protein